VFAHLLVSNWPNNCMFLQVLVSPLSLLQLMGVPWCVIRELNICNGVTRATLLSPMLESYASSDLRGRLARILQSHVGTLDK
jgi:hypothetical protein